MTFWLPPRLMQLFWLFLLELVLVEKQHLEEEDEACVLTFLNGC
jgi:hypothetical protein